jgi:hypothetical protein
MKLSPFIQHVALFVSVLIASPLIASSLTPEEEAAAARHKAVAQERAETYFQYEYQVGSNAVKVTSSRVTIEETLPVQGWSGRFRTTGKAFVEYFDSVSRIFNRVNRDFEITSEQKADTGTIKVVDLKVR